MTKESPEGAAGFIMPAEWERHDATWLAFPHNTADWPGRFSAIPWVYADLIGKIARAERVELMVTDAAEEKKARGMLLRSAIPVTDETVRFHHLPTNRVWTRDSGPIFVRRPGANPTIAIAQFRFNAWAKYNDFDLDDKVPLHAAASLNVPLMPVTHNGRDVVLEGGSIDVNGQGSILTTEECLLDPTVQIRNPGFTRTDYGTVFRNTLGATNTIWLGQGIAGDDTHGHVDDLARFVNPNTIVLCQEKNERDANHRPLADNLERLQSAHLENGNRPTVVPLPMPAPIVFKGQRLPASYANFYICNAAVLVPTFNDPNDRIALGLLADLISDRPVIGIHALDLVWGLGTLHCLSQQQPALPIIG